MDRIIQILDNVRYWETCPEDYKKDIETFLETQNQALRIHDIVGRSEQLPCEHDYQPDVTCGVDIICCIKCGDVI